MAGLHRSLWSLVNVIALSFGAFHCGTSGANSGAPGGLTDAAGTADEGDAADAVSRATEWPEKGVCAFGPIDTLPTCSSDVHQYATCDGSLRACRATSDGGESSTYVCQNLADGHALEWTQAISFDTPCQERTAVSCPMVAGSTDQELVDAEVNDTLSVCLGNESWISVSFVGGCATRFTISSDQPDELACVKERLGKQRYSCAASVSCSGALLSTLH